MNREVLFRLGLTAVVSLGVACQNTRQADKPAPTAEPPHEPARAEGSPATPQPPAQPEPAPVTESSFWNTRVVPNPKDGTEVSVAEVISRDSIPTRDGPMPPHLVVRCMSGKPAILVSTNSLARAAAGKVKFGMRFDSQPARTVAATELPANESFLLPNPEKELAAIGKAKTLTLSFTEFNGTEAVFSFPVSGFSAARQELRKNCPSIP